MNSQADAAGVDEATRYVNMLKALSDPTRWSIVQQVGEAGELPCRLLEQTLSVSKATVSHHAKILIQADILRARKEGRYLHYALRPENLRALSDALSSVAPLLRPVRDDGSIHHSPATTRRGRSTSAHPALYGAETAVGETGTILTW
jgi:DNA-binding transcriptional ArsR family regulator